MANQSQSPSTPVKVPSSAANYTSATLDPDLRSQINTLLIKDGHVTKIQDQLLHSLNANPSNWPTLVQQHAVSLLRSGETTTFPALFKRVMEDVRHDMALAGTGGGAANGAATTEVNGATGAGAGAGADGSSNGGNSNGTVAAASTSTARPNLAVPQSVIEEALKVTGECLEQVCELDKNGTN